MGTQHMLEDAQPQPQIEQHRRHQSDQEGAQRTVGGSGNGIHPINHSGWAHLNDLNLVAANNQLKQLDSASRLRPLEWCRRCGNPWRPRPLALSST